MNKILAKVATGGLMALFGFEIGQNTSPNDKIVVKLEKEDLEITHEKNHEAHTNELLIMLIIFFMILFITALVYAMCRKNKVRNTSTLRQNI